MNHEIVLEGVYVFILFILIFALGMFAQFALTSKHEQNKCIKQNTHLPYKDVQKLCVETLK